MNGEKDLEDLTVGDHFRVERDLDDLRMTGAAAAHLLVGRIGHVSAGIPRNDALDAAQLVVDGLQAPEASASQRGGFEVGRVVGGHTMRM